MTDATDVPAADAFEQWQEERTASVSAPYGPLSLTGTHWIDDHPDGRLPAIPGTWRVDGDTVVRTLDGEETRLGADATVTLGERRLVVIVREGLWGVRDFDPASPARTAFVGIDATPYDPDWSVEGRFTPYEGGHTDIRVENADGRKRALGLAGELAFTLAGQEHTLQVAQQPDGRLWAVFADATSGRSSYRFRFLYPQAPDAEGRTTVDLNRATLPPCAFADHFVCPFPPPGNTLTVGVEAGERNLATAPSV
ncbi:DUF1684 domain-containing protein [Streptomyces sp. SID8379]|uniref:DUF1684 domain-containing protein n=1 Tax=unclassified Streptomyces TaxID=2593676 RepID=UPI000382CFAC|nr:MULTISPECIES: DUF1684 domain-containing protein [unclassified Streptomyces]MYW69638.1 DUF1684 domain-containing protein [Streptomyces sp. SID8379]